MSQIVVGNQHLNFHAKNLIFTVDCFMKNTKEQKPFFCQDSKLESVQIAVNPECEMCNLVSNQIVNLRRASR